MDISDFILRLESDLKEKDASGLETKLVDTYEEFIDSNKKLVSNEKKKKGHIRGNKDEDELSDLEDDVDSDVDDSDDEKESDLDIDMEIDLKKASSYSEFVNIVNHFRAGASFKKNEEIEKYWDRLSRSEKMSLFALLSALTQISGGGLSGGSAKLPSELGIKTSKNDTKKEKAISKNQKSVIKSVGPSKDDAPIKVGESQDIKEIKKYLRNING